MKRKFTLCVALFLTLISISSNAQTVYRSITTGNWGANTTWEISTDNGINYSATTTASQTPGSTSDVIILTGHVVTLDASGKNCKNLTINAGGQLKSTGTSERTIRINGSTLLNNGTLGASVGGTDVTTVELNTANTVGGFTITGSGYANLCRVRMVGGNTNNGGTNTLTIDQNMLLQIGANGVAASYGLSALQTPAATDNYTITINSGKTVTITGGWWHNSGSSGGAAQNVGNYTYNINGTLDLSSSTASTNSSNFIGSADASKTVTVNINGTVKLPTSGNSGLNFGESTATGQQGAVIFNVSGLLDASNAPISNSTTTLPPRFFKLTAGGIVRRNVGTTSTSFPVSANGSVNTVSIANTGTVDNYSVNVKNVFDVTPPASKRVDLMWTINEGTAGGSAATVTLSWTTADQTPGFTTNSPVFIYRYNGTSWEATPATVTGTGTIPDPYIATASGFTAFSPFAVGNSPILPVSFINNKAYTKGNGVQVEWTTAEESNLSSFIVEKSNDGRTFTPAASVPIDRNGSYSWFDASPASGVNYYRIRSGEVTGYSKYTSIMKVSVGKRSAEMIIASNPVKGNALNLQLSGMEKGAYTLSVFNTAGQQVFTKALVLEGSSLSQNISLPQIGKGLFTVRLQSSSSTLTNKIIVE